MTSDMRVADALCQRAIIRLRRIVLGFFAAAVVSLLVFYIVSPEMYVRLLMLQPDPANPHPSEVTVFIAAVVILVALLATGVVRRWRWVFWLVMAAFTLSGLQILAVPFELAGVVSPGLPLWYILLRGVISALLLVIGVWMIRIYRRCGVWGAGRGRISSGAA
jgi:hypothetical protein